MKDAKTTDSAFQTGVSKEEGVVVGVDVVR